jgi:dTDP-4-amino-4,6-dideoxygalactose transaminase
LRRPVVPPDRQANGHIYYVLVPSSDARTTALRLLRDRGVDALFHYVPLHSAPAGRRYGRVSGSLPVTEDLASRLIRLPLWCGMTDTDLDTVVDTIRHTLKPVTI